MKIKLYDETEIGPDGLCCCENCRQAKLITRLTDAMVKMQSEIDALKIKLGVRS